MKTCLVSDMRRKPAPPRHGHMRLHLQLITSTFSYYSRCRFLLYVASYVAKGVDLVSFSETSEIPQMEENTFRNECENVPNAINLELC